MRSSNFLPVLAVARIVFDSYSVQARKVTGQPPTDESTNLLTLRPNSSGDYEMS
jgi:hypothetical protein